MSDWEPANGRALDETANQIPPRTASGGVLPWALLVIGSVASLAAKVAVAQPTLIGRVIAACLRLPSPPRMSY